MSRLQVKLVSAADQKACSRIRELLAKYRQNEDLINIGAYRAGSNADVDQAIAMQEALRAFCIQTASENVPLNITLQQLRSLAA